jgi:hydrogenase expression/formation protein HypC
MCLAIPGRVVAIDGPNAEVDFSGVRRQVLLDLVPDLKVGDYALVHAGFVIQRLEPAEAAEILDTLAGLAAAAEEEEGERGR